VRIGCRQRSIEQRDRIGPEACRHSQRCEQAHCSKWYDAVPLTPYWKDQLQKAKAKPGARKPGKVIAELTLGFWVDLLKADNHRVLWVDKKLNAAFPNAVG
jgi:hypothetical protein